MRSVKLFYASIGLLLALSAFTLILSFQLHFTLAGSWGCTVAPEGYHEVLSLSFLNAGLLPLACLLTCHPFLNWLFSKRWPLRELKKLLATMLLTRGTVYVNTSTHKYAVRYYGRSLVLHKIFCALLNRVYKVEVEPARWRIGNSYVTQVYRREVVEDMLALSPTYTCRNRGEPSPSAAFLLESESETLKTAIRLAASSSGSIGYIIEKCNGGFVVRPFFTLGHLSPPRLLLTYQQALARLGLETHMVYDRRFGERGFLRSRSWKTLENLAKIGGYIQGVKIGSGSREGLEKNQVLQALLSFHQHGKSKFPSYGEALKAVEESLHLISKSS